MGDHFDFFKDFFFFFHGLIMETSYLSPSLSLLTRASFLGIFHVGLWLDLGSSILVVFELCRLH